MCKLQDNMFEGHKKKTMNHFSADVFSLSLWFLFFYFGTVGIKRFSPHNCVLFSRTQPQAYVFAILDLTGGILN